MVVEIERIATLEDNNILERYPSVIDVVYIKPFVINLIFKSGKVKTVRINTRDKVHVQFVK